MVKKQEYPLFIFLLCVASSYTSATLVGVKWSASYGETADYADGEDEESALVMGVKASF
ncbi:MAG: hypothetical protein ACPG4B_03055 [Cycloclasticus sp.]